MVAAMITHVVLLKPRPDLSDADRRAFVASFERAVRTIPSVRGVRVGRRLLHAAGYESISQPLVDFLALIDFDDLGGLRAYLEHPAHSELGARFSTSLAGALVYDFETGGIETIEKWLAPG
jgi:Stress responsive A/B Barrel Domain